jgi:hypothetical protein
MPTRRCCCSTCLLGADNFDRPNANPPTGRWHVLDGEWEIDDQRLVCVDPGTLATTICHPNQYPLGSFEAIFDLVDIEDGSEFIFSGGDPGNPKVEVTITFTGSPGTGTVTIEIDTDGEDILPVFPMVWVDDPLHSVRFCYAPGLEATVLLFTPDFTYTPLHTACMDETDTDNCWTSYNPDLGNFSFNKGNFDNWEYYVHWHERKDCQFCSCFCRLFDGEEFDYACIPEEIQVTLTSDSEICSGIDGTYPMYQRVRFDGPEDAPPSVSPTPQKISWVTDPIACPESDSFAFVLELECIGTGKDDIGSVPQFAMNCIVWNTAAARGSNFGFDCDDPDTTQCATATAFENVSVSVCKQGTCNPIVLEFPDLRENFYNLAEGNSCCGGYVDSGGAFEPDVRISVVVTE